MKKKPIETTKEVSVVALETRELNFFILGTTPLIQNQLSMTAMQELLYPSRRANEAELATRLKHDPVQEFRDSVHESKSRDSATHVVLPTKAFTKAIAQAAIDTPGNAKKAKMMRLVKCPLTEIALFGVPLLYMTNVRVGRDKTPDVRTRAIFERWACVVTLAFDPKLVQTGVVSTLFSAAGTILGAGDDRPEKGGSFGQYTIVTQNDPKFLDVVKYGDRPVQEASFETPSCYDRLSEQLLNWFQEQLVAREQAPKPRRKAA